MTVNWLENWLRNKSVHHLLRLAFALAITIALAPFKLDLLESASYDLRMRLSPQPASSGQIVLIPIEFETLKQLKHEPSANEWRSMLEHLNKAKPREIVSFINPSKLQGSFAELSSFADLAGRLPFEFGEDDVPRTGATKMDPLAPPFDRVPVMATPKTSDLYVGAKDGVSRRLILSFQNQFTLPPKIAATFNGIQNQGDYLGTFPVLDSIQMMINYRKKGAYPYIPFVDVLEGRFDPTVIHDKVALIGIDTLEATADYVTTPIAKNLLAMSLLEMQANILDTLIMNQAPRYAPEWVKLVLTFLISLLTMYIVLKVRPGKGLLMLLATLVLFGLGAVVLFSFRWVVPVAHPLVAVFICYYFVIPYRLIIENRRSWEYYQKNQLLTQVEELKSNFMRMMSHDLKTPLARIQGMAEVIRNEMADLNETQRIALDSISESSEELMQFIGSVLSLSRIRSKEMKLDLRSRDINQVLRDVIRKCEYLAKRKNIEIVSELEPLFSIKVDENLLKTVFSNLLENAIKYSNEESKILVTSEEGENFVTVQFADQGRGIAPEEMTKIFERFYRASNSRTDTPGNGLGLYLARYFVELHAGRIEVESELTKGSTFTVHLPMNLGSEADAQLDMESDSDDDEAISKLRKNLNLSQPHDPPGGIHV